MNTIQATTLDWISQRHQQRLGRDKSYGRKGSNGVKAHPLDTVADLLLEWTGWRGQQTFGDALDEWLTDFGLDDAARESLITWAEPQLLPADQVAKILTDAGVNLKDLELVHRGIFTHEYLKAGGITAPETVLDAALIAVGSPELDDLARAAAASWIEFQTGVYLYKVAAQNARAEDSAMRKDRTAAGVGLPSITGGAKND